MNGKWKTYFKKVVAVNKGTETNTEREDTEKLMNLIIATTRGFVRSNVYN
jgi:hypothetical protein